MRIARALKVAFYPRWLMAVIFGAIVAVCFVSAVFVETFPLLISISYAFSMLLMALALKLMFSAILGQMYGVIVGPYRDDMPVGTMFLLAIALMIFAVFLAAPLLKEAAVRNGIPM
jgi:hypothetical protein